MGLEKITDAIKKATARPTIMDALTESVQEGFDQKIAPHFQLPIENGRKMLYEDPRIAEEAAKKKGAGRPKSRFDEITGR